jgi:hypothetical protein
VWGLLCVAAACGGGDDDGGDDGTRADSGGGPAADASGGDGGADGGRPDASAPDGGDPDGAPDDASSPPDAGAPDGSTPGLVSFTVNLGPPWTQQGHRVFFLRADDSVVSIAVTDDSGRAEAMFDEPGTVVADLRLDQPGASPTLLAYLGVAPGTDIRHGEGLPDRAGTLVATGPAPQQPFGFGLHTQCGQIFTFRTDPVATVELASCPPVIDVIWTAGGLVDGVETVFSVYQPSVPVNAGSITVKGTLRADLIQTTRAAGIPDVSDADLLYWVRGPHGRVQEGAYQIGVPVNAGVAQIVDPMHDLTGLGLRGRLITSWYHPLSDTAVDVTATLLHDGSPDVNFASVVPPVLSDSVLDRATGVWTWSEEGPNPPTAVQGFVFLNDPGRSRSWQIVAPHDGTSVRLPRLPPPYQDLNIAADSSVQDLQLQLVTHNRGYAPIVANIAGVLYDAGQVGDMTALEYGFDDIAQ